MDLENDYGLGKVKWPTSEQVHSLREVRFENPNLECIPRVTIVLSEAQHGEQSYNKKKTDWSDLY